MLMPSELLKVRLQSQAARHDGCVDALASQRVDVAGRVADDEQVVVERRLQALGTQPQARRLQLNQFPCITRLRAGFAYMRNPSIMFPRL